MSNEVDKALSQEIGKLSILIADPSSSRKSIRSLLSQLGAKPAQVTVVENMSDALENTKIKKPNVIFGDSTVFGADYMQLVKLQRESVAPDACKAFFLLTSKDSNIIATNAADDEIDSVLIKPFTMDSLKTEVVEVLRRKIKPTPFESILDQARILFNEGKDEEALSLFLKHKN